MDYFPIPGRMDTSPRTLRAVADRIANHKAHWRPAQWNRYRSILAVATTFFARYGHKAISKSALARGLAIAPATLTRYFVDLDSLLAEILRQHITTLATTLAEITPTTQNHRAARRSAYLAATRTPKGALTDAHTLLVHSRHFLPDDLLPEIEAAYQALGPLLATENPAQTLAYLDVPFTTQANIEQLLTALTPTATKAPAPPAPRPPTPFFAARPIAQPKTPHPRDAEWHPPVPIPGLGQPITHAAAA